MSTNPPMEYTSVCMWLTDFVHRHCRGWPLADPRIDPPRLARLSGSYSGLNSKWMGAGPIAIYVLGSNKSWGAGRG